MADKSRLSEEAEVDADKGNTGRAFSGITVRRSDGIPFPQHLEKDFRPRAHYRGVIPPATETLYRNPFP